MENNQTPRISSAERREIQREKIQESIAERKRNVIVIPEKPELQIGYAKAPGRKLNVAAYCRVSTESENQLFSYELQCKTYTELIEKNPDWQLYKIFADEGISGTNRSKRENFNRMIVDCQLGKIDLILTKSISRFARNTMDTLSVTRYLSSLNPPVSVYFENEHINSSDVTTGIALILLASLAEEESHSKSESMRWSIRERFKNGRYMLPTTYLLAYTKIDGRLVIEPDKAVIIELIYSFFLAGFSQKEIADVLNDLGCVTVKENQWTPAAVTGILRNEKYCGDVRAQKTVTLSFRTHQVVKNIGQEKQYYEIGHHEGIVTRKEYLMAQCLLDSKSYAGTENLTGAYQIRAISKGLLNGFIPLHRSWAGNELKDYLYISDMAANRFDEAELPEQKTVSLPVISGFEVVRSAEASPYRKAAVNISHSGILFNRACLQELDNCEKVEILLHPEEKLIAVRKAGSFSEEAIVWRKETKNGNYAVRNITSKRINELLMELMGWLPVYRCHLTARIFERSCGMPQNGSERERVLVFNLAEPITDVFPEKRRITKARVGKPQNKTILDIEALIAQQTEELRQQMYGSGAADSTETGEGHSEALTARKERFYPESWKDNFGERSENHRTQRLDLLYDLGYWDVSAEADVVNDAEDVLDITDELLTDLTKKAMNLALGESLEDQIQISDIDHN